MAKFDIKNTSYKIKSALLLSIIIVALILETIFLLNFKSSIYTAKQNLQSTYTAKNLLIYNAQKEINGFIVNNHISFAQLEDFSSIQNAFNKTNDSINYFIAQYSHLTKSYTESSYIDDFKTNYEIFMNIIYEIFNEYKADAINLKRVSKLFNKETSTYGKLTEILKELKIENNKNLITSLNEINRTAKKTTLTVILTLIFFSLILISTAIYSFKNDFSSKAQLTEIIEKLLQSKTLDIDENEKNTEILLLKKLHEKNQKINFYLQKLKNKNYNLQVEDEYKNDLIISSIVELSEDLKKSEEELLLRKKEDEQKEWANQGINMFSELMRRYSNDIQTLGDEIIKNFVKYLDASVGGIFILQDEENDPHLELLSAFAYDRKKFFTKRVELGEGLIGTVAIDKATIYLDKLPDEYLEIESGLGDAPPNTLLILPLLTDNGLLGVVEIAAFKTLDQFEIDFSENLAHTIASTIESVKINARTVALLKESEKKSLELAEREKILQKTMQEVQKAHETARKNEIEMRGILSGVDQTLMRAEYLPDGTFLNSNLVHRRVMGYDIEKMRGKNILEFIPEEGREEFLKIWKDVAAGRPYQVTVKRQNKQTGADIWLLNQYTPIKDENGNVIKILYLAIDITEQKLTEEMTAELLMESQQKEIELRGILSGIDRTILRAEYSPDGIFLDANEMHTKILGYDKQQMIGKSILEFIADEEKEKFEKFWKEIKTGTHKELIVKRINKSTGQEIWLINQYNPIVNDNGEVIKILYLAIDITEQKIAEEKAQKLLQDTMEKELELRALFTAVDQTLMRAEYSPDGTFIDANELHVQTLGYDKEKMLGQNILEFIADDEKEEFLKIWNSVKSGSIEQITVKRQNKETGEDIWLLNQYTPIEDEQGNVQRILYLAIDITEQKHSEEKVKQLLEKTKEDELEIKGILTAVDKTIIRAEYKKDGTFIAANELYTKIFGFDKENIQGKQIFDIFSAEKEKLQDIWKQLETGKVIQKTEKIKNSKTQDEFWLLNQYSPVFDTKGNLKRVIYLGLDISEQKLAEEMATELLLESQKKEIELNSILQGVDKTLMRARYSKDGTFIEANEIHQRVMGYELTSMIGKNIKEFIPQDELDEFNQIWTEVTSGNPKQIIVHRYNKTTGEELYILSYYNPIYTPKGDISGILYLGIDITEQKQLEQKTAQLLKETQQSQARLQGILQGIDKSILRAEYTPDGIFIDANEIHAQILGYNIEQMKGKSILEFLEESEREEFEKFWKDVKAGQSKELTVKRQNKQTGNDIWLINQYNPVLDEQGNLIRIIFLAVDITEQKRLEQELMIQEKIMNQNMQELFAEYQALEEKYEQLKQLEEDIKTKHDTEIDKLYDDWLNSFE